MISLKNIISKISLFCSQFKLEKEDSDILHSLNRITLEKIYLFAMIFGIVCLAVVSIISPGPLPAFKSHYYISYIVIGITGLVLCNLPFGKYLPSVFCLGAFYYILLFFLMRSDVGKFYLFFAEFSFVLIVLLNLNPFLFSVSIILYAIVLMVLFMAKVFVLQNKDGSEGYLVNIFFMDSLIIYLSFWKRRSVIKKFNEEKSIKAEKQKSEELLLNTLPYSVMEELRETGKSVPKSFDNTTVLYCAISNFDELSQTLPAQAFVNLLNVVVDTFDSIIENESCYRVKTTNNIYMAICGLPQPDPDHAARMVSCAKRFLSYINLFNETSDVKIRIKIGLNSGKVVAGIVGTKKYIYDVFGDTVNIACRMEMLCEEMKIRLTSKTYELSKEYFESTLQTPIMVKGKGMMESYYISD